MAESWVRLWAGMNIDGLSESAICVAKAAFEDAWGRRTCYPNWHAVQKMVGLEKSPYLDAFDELCERGIVFHGFPSLLVALADIWPLTPMWGPLEHSRPSATVWASIKRRIFERDDFTCQYCGARGVLLECDHITPIAQGGGHEDKNLTTACMPCNRSKGAKTPEQWKATK